LSPTGKKKNFSFPQQLYLHDRAYFSIALIINKNSYLQALPSRSANRQVPTLECGPPLEKYRDKIHNYGSQTTIGTTSFLLSKTI
jgi:hypothetical protein